MRSQLDCRDPRLPGSGVFDIKTRACLSIRQDIVNYMVSSIRVFAHGRPAEHMISVKLKATCIPLKESEYGTRLSSYQILRHGTGYDVEVHDASEDRVDGRRIGGLS